MTDGLVTKLRGDVAVRCLVALAGEDELDDEATSSSSSSTITSESTSAQPQRLKG